MVSNQSHTSTNIHNFMIWFPFHLKRHQNNQNTLSAVEGTPLKSCPILFHSKKTNRLEFKMNVKVLIQKFTRSLPLFWGGLKPQHHLHFSDKKLLSSKQHQRGADNFWQNKRHLVPKIEWFGF